jgi:uncharacterized membrane protein
MARAELSRRTLDHLFALVAGSGTLLGVLVGGLFGVFAFVSSVVVFGALALVFYW